MWKIIQAILSKNNSPAYQKIGGLLGLVQKASGNSAKTTNQLS